MEQPSGPFDEHVDSGIEVWDGEEAGDLLPIDHETGPPVQYVHGATMTDGYGGPMGLVETRRDYSGAHSPYEDV